jgi:hypothetical protein
MEEEGVEDFRSLVMDGGEWPVESRQEAGDSARRSQAPLGTRDRAPSVRLQSARFVGNLSP